MVPFDPGYVAEPFVSLVADYPDESVYPSANFRTEWGPVFHRGRLDGSARVLVIGQDPAQHEVIVRRILVGTAGKRAQGFLKRLGFDRSYVFINAFLYSVYGQSSGNQHINSASITAYRNKWIAAILDTQQIGSVIAFGGLAKSAWQAWTASPQAQGRPALTFVPLTHPTWPESSSPSPAAHKAAIKTMLQNWNNGLDQLGDMQHRDVPGAVVPYGKAFKAGDLPDIPAFDVPAGVPDWMRTENAWATRTGRSAAEKRRTIVVRVPDGLIT